ncbi:MAG: NfeD family protein [Bacteroidia bacterium]|nr:NfeD family protein [Bacteroidia bacterium]
MENLIPILTWVSVFSGGLLIFLLLFSIVGGMDLDLDVDTSTDAGVDTGGIGFVKGGLTLISVTTWVMKIVLLSQENIGIAIIIGLAVAFVALWILNYIFRFLIRNEENVNWAMEDAIEQLGEVYLRIPPKGEGIVNVLVNGVNRELKAVSMDKQEIKTGDKVRVVGIDGEFVKVKKETV